MTRFFQLNNSKKFLIAGMIAALLGAPTIVAFSYADGIQRTGVALEQGLSGEYQSAQNELDNYTKTIKESVGIANLKSKKLDEIIRNAVAGRYEGEVKPGQGGAFFSAITEAYPEIDLSVYDRIVDQVVAGREAFKQKQNKLRDMIRAYETWVNSGIIKSRFISVMGFPSDNLEARIGTDATYGRDALSQMKVLITSKDTSDAYRKGEQEPIEFE